MAYTKLKHRIHEIIFEADTPAGKFFDVVLLIFILGSISVSIFESVEELRWKYGTLFTTLEWFFTIVFTIEYILRLYAVKKSWKYVFSFYGLVDLLSILPAYIALFLSGGQFFAAIRALRLLRVFRVLKMVQFLKEYNLLLGALRASITKIMVFLGAILTIVVIVGTAMYAIESNHNEGFSSIPKSMYWAVVTMTTVGYGDITPQTNIGQFFSACLMILGYAIIAVPTGIVSAEVIDIEKQRKLENISTQSCTSCSKEGHDSDAEFCKFCGEKLD